MSKPITNILDCLRHEINNYLQIAFIEIESMSDFLVRNSEYSIETKTLQLQQNIAKISKLCSCYRNFFNQQTCIHYRKNIKDFAEVYNRNIEVVGECSNPDLLIFMNSCILWLIKFCSFDCFLNDRECHLFVKDYKLKPLSTSSIHYKLIRDFKHDFGISLLENQISLYDRVETNQSPDHVWFKGSI